MLRRLMVMVVVLFASVALGKPVLDVVETTGDYYTITAKEADDSAAYWVVKVDIASGGIFSFKDLTDAGSGGGHVSYLDTDAYSRRTTLMHFDGRAGNVLTRNNPLDGLADRLTYDVASDGSSFTIHYTENENTQEFLHESYADGAMTLSKGDLYTTITLVIRPPASATSGTYWDWQASGLNVSDHDLSPKIWAAEYIYFYIHSSIVKSSVTETSLIDGEFDLANPKSYAKWDIGDNVSMGLNSDLQFVLDPQSGLASHTAGGTVSTGVWAGFDYLRYTSPFDFSGNALSPGQSKVYGGQFVIRKDSDVPVNNVGPTADAGADQTVLDADRNGEEAVTMDGSGSSDPDGNIASYIWREAGSQVATGEFGVATFLVGVHTIELTVTDNQGATDVDTVVVTVEEPPPSPAVADAGEDQRVKDEDGDGFESITLDGSGSYSSAGAIVSWVWEEDGSQIAAGETAVVSFAVGLHTVLLTVTDADGNTNSDVVVVIVPSSVVGNTYYVDAVNGLDTNPGTRDEPWQTMDKALTTAGGGDLVLFGPGDYGQVITDGTHELGDPVNGYLTLRADPARVVARPADWWRNPMESSFANPSNRAVLRQLRLDARANGHYVEFDGFDVYPTVPMPQGSVIGGSNFVSHVVLRNLNGFGWWDEEMSGIYFQESYGVEAFFHDIVVDSCFVRDLGSGIRLGGDSGSNIVFSNNHVYRVAGSALQMLYGRSYDTILLEHNHVHFHDPVLYGDGTDYTHGSGISIRREKLHIARNIIHNYGTSRGIYIYSGIEFADPTVGYQDLLIENNLLYDTNNYPIDLRDIGRNVVVRNNTIVGFTSLDGPRLGMRYYMGLLLGYYNDSVTDGVSYYNNVIVGGLGGQAPGNNEGRNIVWSMPHSYPTQITPGSTSIVLAGLDNMLNGYPQDYFEGSNNFFIGGPLFDLYSYTRNPTPPINEIRAHGYNLNECYELAEGSPGIGFGDPNHAPTVDLYGNIRSTTAPSVGAFEFGASGTRVIGRYVFYNNSSFDGNDAGANTADDAAIATDKTALRYGETATFANYTSYSKGINGVMIDILGAADATSISASDFELTVGEDSSVDFWPPAPTPVSVIVRQGGGINGSDRVTIIFADGAITGKWLNVKVLPTVNTGLTNVDEFFFGNAIGETGNSVSDAIVDATDEIGARNNPRHFLKPAQVDDVYDFNRDEKVDATDEILARNHVTTMMTSLKLIQP